jgi:starch-binding outer membrane protein SusE/F
MKKSIKLLSLLMTLSALVFFTSCTEDEPVIDIDENTVIVSDGFYIVGGSAPSETPAASGILSLGIVEDEGFGTKTRANYFESYIYLDAAKGGIQFAKYKDNVAVTYGGATETVDMSDDTNNDTPMGAYLKGAMTEDGAKIVPLQSGLHHVIVDLSTKTFLVVPVYAWGLIGPATAGGWGSDTDVKTISADGMVYSATGVVIRSGTMKMRYNDGWKIDMRTDPNAGYADANGYVALTNLGGTLENLEQGGADFQAPAEGTYDVSITFKNGELSPKVVLKRTGDAPVLAFDFNEYAWGIIGAATTTGWDADTKLTYKGENAGTHKWVGSFYLVPGAFKFRSDANWSKELGRGNATFVGTAADKLSGDNDIMFDGTSTFYYIVITTSDDGKTFKIDFAETAWGVIGAGTPTGWDSDTKMVRDVNGTTWTLTLQMTAGAYKFRANDSWDINLGGDASALTVNGADLSAAAAGSYTITLKTEDKGVTFMSSAVLN